MGTNIQILIILIVSSILVGCGGVSSSGQREPTSESTISPNIENQPMMALNVNTYPVTSLVCDPFLDEDDNAYSFENGVKVEIFKNDSENSEECVSDYVRRGKKWNSHFFMNSLNIRTQDFLNGFFNIVGTELFDTINNQHFALKFTAQLQLSQDQADGFYELAILADESIDLALQIDNQWLTFIDAQGDEMVRMHCSTAVVELKKGQKYPFEIHYKQSNNSSPIALVPLLRQQRKNQNQDPFCRQGHQKRDFFEKNKKGVALPAYQSLLARGWRVVSGENLFIPQDEEFNPCAGDPQTPEINNFYFEFGANTITVFWETDIPSTSQVVYVRSDTGEEVLTEADNVLRTFHAVSIPKNPSGVSYLIRAISISESYGKAVSGGYSVHSYF